MDGAMLHDMRNGLGDTLLLSLGIFVSILIFAGIVWGVVRLARLFWYSVSGTRPSRSRKTAPRARKLGSGANRVANEDIGIPRDRPLPSPETERETRLQPPPRSML